MPEFIDWKEARDPARVRDHAAAVLEAGGWVAFPTETGLALAARADRPDTLRRIPPNGLAWSLALPESINLDEWTGPQAVATRRLVRRTWPGPVTYVFAEAAKAGPAAQLPAIVLERVAPNGELALRQPAHDAILNVLAATGHPLVMGEPPRADAAWLGSLGDHVDLVIEGGPTYFDQPATRVRIKGDDRQIETPGVYDEPEMRRLTACLILFVCTGNTCRSPMAEALCKVLLAERLGCSVDELPERGWWVMSAGVSAYPGDPSPPEAHQAVQAFGADLSKHQSRPVRPELAALADHVIVMTENHRIALLELFPQLGVEPRLLCGGDDLTDPVGGTQDVYDRCAQQIRAHLEGLVAEVTAP